MGNLFLSKILFEDYVMLTPKLYVYGKYRGNFFYQNLKNSKEKYLNRFRFQFCQFSPFSCQNYIWAGKSIHGASQGGFFLSRFQP